MTAIVPKSLRRKPVDWLVEGTTDALPTAASERDEYGGSTFPVDRLGELSAESFDPFDVQLLGEFNTIEERLAAARDLYNRITKVATAVEIESPGLSPEEVAALSSDIAADEEWIEADVEIDETPDAPRRRAG